MTDPSLEPLVTYLREHSVRYSLEAIREQLLQSGHDPATVEQAIAIYHQEGLPQPELPAGSKVGRGALRTCLVVAAILALVVLAVGGFCLYLIQTS